MMRPFELLVLTPAPLLDPAVAIAASRAGATGILNLEYCRDAQAAGEALAALARFGRGQDGVKLAGGRPDLLEQLLPELPEAIGSVILTPWHLEQSRAAIPILQQQGRRLLIEVTSAAQAEQALTLGAGGLIAKGNEAGGWVGEETTFILLQRLLSRFEVPIWAYGGIGLHTAAACYAAGAAGVALDAQLALAREARLPQAVQAAIGTMDGSETITLGSELGHSFRVYRRPGAAAVDDLAGQAVRLAQGDAPAGEKQALWEQAVADTVGWGPLASALWPLGQDAAFAAALAGRYRTVGGILEAVRGAIQEHLRQAAEARPLDGESPLARSHGTRYPVVQGPMTRVSDRVEFAQQVAQNGALPFLALALMRAEQVEPLLTETSRALGEQPWGVGILGFVPLGLREEQLEVIHRVKPPYALIAGGRPDQALALEEAGIPTYLHVPSPGLLRLFLQDGARRFVFEGRECGGHVGPRSSFVLWNEMVDVLLEELKGGDAARCHILFAGGIHERVSAAMVATLAAPLAARGVKVGVLMGTAYLFTEEAVGSGSILPGFQEEALHCTETVLLESGPGHATRCVPNQFVHIFQEEKQRLQQEGKSSEEIRHALEELNVGRLRIASKGITRHPHFGQDPDAPKYVVVDGEEQHREGMYMIGQLAALREATCTMAELHREVALESTRLLEEVAGRGRVSMVPEGARPSQVAIVGMSTLLPQAPTLQEFWSNLVNRVKAIKEVPAERWDASLYHSEDRQAEDKIYSTAGGFLDDVLFDPLEFGIPPNSLPSIDPMHLLALLAARDALADAGYAQRPFDRSRTSVILGASGGTGDLGAKYLLRAGLPLLFGEEGFEIAQAADGALPEWTEDSFAGLLLNVAAGRIANRMDFGGLNYVVDAACASSLAAVHLAVKELETKGTDVVLVGGVDTVQNPFGYLCFSKTQALSPTGEPRVFDTTADGIVISEGVVMLVLKRLEDAERDGDRIYAVISAVAGSSDGRGMGMTAPRPEGQTLALERAYAKAGFSPTTVGLFEAHGTGTVVGDRTEASALSQFLEGKGAVPQQHAIGSVKSLIGHTKATAGVAGLAKVASALYHKVLPPTLVTTEPNTSVDFDNGPLYVNAETRPWIQGTGGQPRRAGVSAFGFGGTNFHAVVEEYRGDFLDERPATLRQWPSELFLWRADSGESLRAQLGRLAQQLAAGATPALRDLAYSLWQEARPAGGVRLAIVARSLTELHERLNVALGALQADGTATIHDPRGIYYTAEPLAAAGKVAFLFPGQGSQYPNMVRDLALHFPEVRQTLERADRALAAFYERPLSSFIFPPPAFTAEAKQAQRQALTATNVAQPALGASESALLRLLELMGVRPELAAGHSYGEYAALYAAGVLDEETLLHLSEARGRFIVEATGAESGTMAAARAGAAEIRPLVEGLDEVWLANFNAPRQTILSGSERGIAAAVARLGEHGIQARPIPVACAFHSPLVAPAQERLAARLAESCLAPPEMDVYANATAAPYERNVDAVRALLAEQLIRPVRFAEQIEAMYAAGARLFVEVGPQQVLSDLTRQILDDRPHLAVALDSPSQHGLTQLQQALGQLVVHGVPLHLERLFAGREPRLLNLERLIEETAAATPPVTAWLVNGSRARPLQGPPDEPHTPPLAGLLAAATTAPAATPTQSVPAPLSSSSPAAGDEGTAAVMDQFQQTMQHFLETQRSVMLNYLQGAPAAPPAGSSAATAPQAAPAADLPQAESAPPAPAAGPEPPPAEAVPATTGAVPTRARLTEQLLQIVGDRTGYPPEMLQLDVDIEATLGIDSIKRVEIMGILQREAIPAERQLSPQEMEELSSIKTLGKIVDWLEQLLAGTTQRSHRNGHLPPAPAEPAVEPLPAARPGAITRYRLSYETAPPLPAAGLSFPAGRVMVITGDGRLARALAEEVRRRGGRAVRLAAQDGESVLPVALDDAAAVRAALDRIRAEEGPIGGLVHLLPLDDAPPWTELDLAGWRERLARSVKSLFYLAQAAAADLKEAVAGGQRAWVVAATALGRVDDEETAGPFPGQAGIAGLLKSLALEWPDVTCKSVHLDPAADQEQLLAHLLAEMADDGGPAEVRYRAGLRQWQVATAAALSPGATPELAVDSDWVVLVTGGARGITAEIACDLAERFKPTLLLLGRSPEPPAEETVQTRDLDAARDLKAALLDQLQVNGTPVALAEVEAAYRRLLREREMRRNLERMRAAGATVRYVQGDVRDEEGLRQILQTIQADFGRLDAVIHGAGIIEDKLVEDKTVDSFARVFDTKADSALILSRLLDPQTLHLFALFGSAAGTFGNRGQSDYAATNEVVNALARHLDRRWPGRVVALNWGPWLTSGMVSPALQAEFERRQIELIPVAEGCRLFVQEILHGKKGEVSLLLGGWHAPQREAADADMAGAHPATPRGTESNHDGLLLPLLHTATFRAGEQVEVVRTLDPAYDRYLLDHQLDGAPVLPMAMAMELMSETVQRAWPDLQVAGVRELSVLKGIVVDGRAPEVRVVARAHTEPRHDRIGVDATVQIVDTQTGRAHYRAIVELAARLPEPPPYRAPAGGELQPFPLSVREAYERWLFHGPCFQGIETIDGIARQQMMARVRPSTPGHCLSGPIEGQWLTDPVVFDSCLQLVLLWRRHYFDVTPLPMAFRHFRRFGSLSGGPVTCILEAPATSQDQLFAVDIAFVDANGRLLGRLEQLECSSSRALNRLGGASQQGTA